MQYANRFIDAHFNIVQLSPKILFWASSFLLASKLLPDPHDEQVPKSLNLHTSQFIPQAPVGINVLSFVKIISGCAPFPLSARSTQRQSHLKQPMQ